MKIKLQFNDWEALLGVLNGIPASKQTMSQIAHIETVSAHVISGLKESIEEQKKLLDKQEKLMASLDSEFSAIRARNIGTPDSPEMQQFRNRVQAQLDREVFEPINRLGKREFEFDIPDTQLSPVRESFTEHAFFGEKGYSDTTAGKASYGRALAALGIQPEDVASVNAVPTQEAPPTVEAPIDPPEVSMGS